MKKLFLPVLFAIVILVITLTLQGNAFAFFHDKDSSGGSEFDCQKFWEGLSDDEGLTIGGPRQGSISNISDWKFSSKKKTMGKASGDSCDIGGIRYDADYDGGEAQTGFEINISYFPNQEEAKDQVSSLKAAESVQVEDQNISDDTYSMRTVKLDSVEGRPHFLASGNFGRTAGKLGNCVVTLTHTWYESAWKKSDVYEDQVALMDEVMGMTQEGWQTLSEAKDLQKFCGGKASDSSSDKQKSQQAKPQRPQSGQTQSEDKENLVIKALGGFPVTIGEWFNAVSLGWGMQEFFYQNELFADEVLFGRDRREIAEEEAAEQERGKVEYQQRLDDYFDKQGLADIDQVFNRMPVIKDMPDYKSGEWQQGSPYSLDILNGQAQIKLPGQSEWKDLKQGDRIPPGSTIFTGMDTTTVLSIQDKGVVQILSFTEVTISEEGLSEPGKTTTEIDLQTGEIEVNIEGGVYTAPLMQVFTTNVVAGVRGTHFWVSHNKDKRLSTVGVYAGEVEVQAKGSDQSTLVSPNGDKPGVIVVTQKLSMIKIATSLVVVLTAIVAIFWFLKRRGKKVYIRRK